MIIAQSITACALALLVFWATGSFILAAVLLLLNYLLALFLSLE